MEKYKIILYCGREGQEIVAEVPELPGCTAHGGTKEEALANVKEAIRLWIENARGFGKPVPKPHPQQMMFV